MTKAHSSQDFSTSLHGDDRSSGSVKRKRKGNSSGIKKAPVGIRKGEATDRGIQDAASTCRDMSTSQTEGNRKKSLTEKDSVKTRQTSLRRVKNSTDVLRQRSTQRSKIDVAPDGHSGGREQEGRFTVANVGNNGMIYLRFVLRPLSCSLKPFTRLPQHC